MTALLARSYRTQTPRGRERSGPRRALVLAGFLLASTALPAAAAELEPLEQISKGNPFADCTADHVNRQDGTLYPRTEIEPFIDSNEARPRNLITVWQQDRWSNGGSRGNASAFTFDGGASWRVVVPPMVTRCSRCPFLWN